MKKIIKCKDIEFKIYVEDTDFQGFVYHANYVKFFERARSNFLSTIKVSQRELRSKNQAFVIKSINLNYLYAAELGDNLVVHTSVEKKSNARMIFHQNQILILGDSLVSLVLALNEKPRIDIFLADIVPKSFSMIILEILCCCHLLIFKTPSQ